MSTQPDARPVPVDPPGMVRSPAFAQGMVLPPGPTLYVGGQNGLDADGTLLDGLGPQTEQALRNVLAVLAEAGTDADHVAILRIFLTAGVDPTAAFEASAAVWGRRRTAVTVVSVPESRPGCWSRSRRSPRSPRPEPGSPSPAPVRPPRTPPGARR